MNQYEKEVLQETVEGSMNRRYLIERIVTISEELDSESNGLEINSRFWDFNLNLVNFQVDFQVEFQY